LLTGRQATTHWAFDEEFWLQLPDVLTETNRMVIDYGDSAILKAQHWLSAQRENPVTVAEIY
jgi:hypothetical protein